MVSRINFLYEANGNLTQLNADTNKLYQGSVATTVYTLEIADALSEEDNILSSDIVLISFKRPDGAQSQQLMTYAASVNAFVMRSSGWEMDCAVTGNVEISFIARRYSSLPPYRLVATRTTEIAEVVLAASSAYVPQDISDSDAEEILAIIGELTAHGIEHETRISAIEDANPLINFTSNVGSGIGTKYYFDGTTATVPLATGSLVEVPDVIPVSILTFSAGNWSLDEETDEYELAFSGTTTGRDNNRYLAAVDIVSGEGYEQTANKVYKGTDGSLLLSGVTEPFGGRVVLFGGTVQIDNDDGSEQNVIEVITRNSIVLPITNKTVNILVPESATDIEYGESTVGAELDDNSERLDALESAIGDIATALDTINGEVI